MTADSEGAIQQSLTGEEAERVECEYYDGCQNDALYIDEILHYGEGEKPVKMCFSCAEERLEDPDNDIRRLKPEDRYVGDEPQGLRVYVVTANYDDDPHPHVELVTTDREEAEELMKDCRATMRRPHPIAWDLTERTVNQRV